MLMLDSATPSNLFDPSTALSTTTRHTSTSRTRNMDSRLCGLAALSQGSEQETVAVNNNLARRKVTMKKWMKNAKVIQNTESMEENIYDAEDEQDVSESLQFVDISICYSENEPQWTKAQHEAFALLLIGRTRKINSRSEMEGLASSGNADCVCARYQMPGSIVREDHISDFQWTSTDLQYISIISSHQTLVYNKKELGLRPKYLSCRNMVRLLYFTEWSLSEDQQPKDEVYICVKEAKTLKQTSQVQDLEVPGSLMEKIKKWMIADVAKEASIPKMWTPAEREANLSTEKIGLIPENLQATVFEIVPPSITFTEQEKPNFLMTMKKSPKLWEKIAAAITGRSIPECIQYYYFMKHEAGFKKAWATKDRARSTRAKERSKQRAVRTWPIRERKALDLEANFIGGKIDDAVLDDLESKEPRSEVSLVGTESTKLPATK